MIDDRLRAAGRAVCGAADISRAQPRTIPPPPQQSRSTCIVSRYDTSSWIARGTSRNADATHPHTTSRNTSPVAPASHRNRLTMHHLSVGVALEHCHCTALEITDTQLTTRVSRLRPVRKQPVPVQDTGRNQSACSPRKSWMTSRESRTLDRAILPAHSY